MKLLTTVAEMDKAIKSIGTRRKAWETDVHIAVCSVINHATDTGDSTVADRLCNQMFDAFGKSARRNVFLEYMESYGPFKYDDNDKVLKLDKARAKAMRKELAADGTTFLNVAGAMGNPWFEWKTEPAYRPIDLEVEMRKLLAKAKDRAESDKGDKIDPKLLQQLEVALPAKPE